MRKSLLILFALLLGCASAPDTPVCKELDIDQGYCVWTLSDREQYVDDENKMGDLTWWELRPSMIMIPADSWVEIKAFVVKICKKTGKCEGKEKKWE